jgi:hypothetical protein
MFNWSDVIPIFNIRLVDESGGSMTGGLAQVGRLGVAPVKRSCTSCRAS